MARGWRSLVAEMIEKAPEVARLMVVDELMIVDDDCYLKMMAPKGGCHPTGEAQSTLRKLMHVIIKTFFLNIIERDRYFVEHSD